MSESLATPRRQFTLSREQISPAQSVIIAGAAYLLIVVCMWGMFAFSSGMPYETAFPYMSETSSLLRGFLYAADPLRPNTSTFYHLSYLLGEVFSPGSFVPFQFVYAALWIARGLLVFAIVKRLLPGSIEVAYIAGALTIVHASDGALQWVGQMNQFGFIFWMLLALYLFVVANDSTRAPAAAAVMLLVMICQYMSLWSYESGVFMVLLMPLAVLLARRPITRQGAVLCAAWHLVPAIYVTETIQYYMRSAGSSYQASVLRTDWSAVSLANDLGFNVSGSLAVWKWGEVTPHPMRPAQAAVLAVLAVVVFLCGGALMTRFAPEKVPSPMARRARIAAALTCAGLGWVVFSFPAYLLLNSARSLWRTQILSGPGAGMVLAGTVALAAIPLRSGRARSAMSLTLAAVVVYYGAYCAVQRGAFHREIWEPHRRTIAAVLRAVPQVKPGTVIVLTGVPKQQDPFGHYMWFDMALRLAYPRTAVAGVYFLDDGSPNPGPGLHLANGRWQWDEKSMAPLVRGARLDETVVVRYEADGVDQVLDHYPDFLCSAACDAAGYSPRSRIAGTDPSPRAVRRYGPVYP